MRIGIMQPYFFPYIGYFQLISAVDKFVYYDDVGYIKNGWINRNRLSLSGEASYFTVPVKGGSASQLINEVQISPQQKNWRRKMTATFQSAYAKAPFKAVGLDILNEVLAANEVNSSSLAIRSIERVCDYLDIGTERLLSSQSLSETAELSSEARVVAMCTRLNSTAYINMLGGQKLYTDETFLAANIKLQFIKPGIREYSQLGNGGFLPGLSILDVIMNVHPAKIREHLSQYSLYSKSEVAQFV